MNVHIFEDIGLFFITPLAVFFVIMHFIIYCQVSKIFSDPFIF